MISLLYSIGIRSYGLLIRLAALFSDKAGLWVKGRANWRQEVGEMIGEKVVWFHCASLGEFEQGRPVIEAWQKDHPNDFILLTFFSPSGYEIRKNFPVNKVMYLPLDTKANARYWCQLNFKEVFFVKYEVWPFLFKELQKKKVTVNLISASFRSEQLYFKKYGKWFLDVLDKCRIFTQDQQSADLLKKHGVDALVTGDTRFDRVAKIVQEAHKNDKIEAFLGGKEAIVCGSTWAADDEILRFIPNEKYKLIIAPHEIHPARIAQLKNAFPDSVLLSEDTDFSSVNCLIVDSIGELSKLYRYGVAAYVGGGFGAGIHNTLEPTAYGVPLIFGPKNQRFQEAQLLKTRGIAFEVETELDVMQFIDYLGVRGAREEVNQAAKQLFGEQKGATTRILNQLAKS